MARYVSRLLLTVFVGLLLFVPGPVQGKGQLVDSGDDQGAVNFTVYFRFPPTLAQIAQLEQDIRDGSKILCEATEGQVWLNDVVFLGGEGKTVLKNDADVWVFPQTTSFRSSVNCSPIATENCRMTLRYDPPLQSSPLGVAHEFAHLLWGLGDEYDIQSDRQGACVQTNEGGWSDSGSHNCLMQALFYDNGQPGNVDYGADELCTDKWHDLVRLDDDLWPDCPAGGDDVGGCMRGDSTPANSDCENRCCLFNYDNCRWEGAVQTARTFDAGNVESCWSTIKSKSPFLAAGAPADNGLPDFSSPNCLLPNINTDGIGGFDRVMLVLDRSYSMAFDPKKGQSCGNGCPEICDNGDDDDGDNQVDEADCNQPAMDFLRKSVDAFLTLASADNDVEVGIVSFASTAQKKSGLVPVADKLGELKTIATNLNPAGNTNIGAGLEKAGLELEDVMDGTRAVLLITDGLHNVPAEEGGVDPMQAIDDLVNQQGIAVFWISTGPEAASDDVLGQFVPGSGGQQVPASNALELGTSFAQQWSNWFGADLVIPDLPFLLGPTTFEPPSELRTPEDWVDHTGPPALPFLNNRFEVHVAEGTERLTVVLAGTMPNMSTYGVRLTASGPAGPHPSFFDSAAVAVDPYLTVNAGDYNTIVRLLEPNPGTWTLEVTALDVGNPEQEGNLTVIAEHPQLDLITSLDRHVVNDTSVPVELLVTPMFLAALRDLGTVEASVRRPDGTVVPLPLVDALVERGGHIGNIDLFPLQGPYEVRVRVRSVATTTAEPGDGLFQNAPPNDLFPVPLHELTAVEHFYVSDPAVAKFCPGGTTGDCDLDTIPDTLDPLTVDTDGDGLVDGCDPDADGDERPDGVDAATDLDGDSVPDHQDPDADGDGIPDGRDANVALVPPVHVLRVSDAEVGVWDDVRTSPLRLSTEEPVVGATVGIQWIPAGPLEVVEILPGDAIDPGDLASFTTAIESGDVGPGQALVSLALSAGTSIDPDGELPLLELRLRARAGALPGLPVTICLVDGLGVPPQNTLLEVESLTGPQSVSPQTFCGTVTFVGDDEPPILFCPRSRTVPADEFCTAVWDQAATAVDTADPTPGVGSTPALPATLFGVGGNEVVYTATDVSGNAAACATTVTLEDTLAPALDVSLTPGVLSPPDHSMVDVTASVWLFEGCSTTSFAILESVTSNEVDDAPGGVDGSTINDIQNALIGSSDTEFSLRAERADSGVGRTYTAVYTAVDGSGNATTVPAYVHVPLGSGLPADPVTLTAEETNLGTRLDWTSVPGASGYDVIRFDLEQLSLTGPVVDLGTVDCLLSWTTATSTAGVEDTTQPLPGTVFGYLVGLDDGVSRSYGTDGASHPRLPGPCR